jgi:hypothetical protein
MIEDLAESTQLLYSQLLDELLRGAYSKRGISLITREVKGNKYWYLQYVVGPSKQSYYLGADDEGLRQRIQMARQLWERDAASAKQRARLVAMLRAGGAVTLPAGHARVLEALEQAGVFVVGGVVVGSHAYALMANSLGVKWDQATLRTQDVDIAHDYEIHVTVPDREVDLEQALSEADKAFFAVPALNRNHPSTSFSIRGSELSVSLLTPMRGAPDGTPKSISSLNAMAKPLRFLDYLLEDLQPAAVPVRQGVLVNIPSPARFALHKLVVSQRRPPAFQTKAKKDVAQAEQVLSALIEDRPGDLLLALDAARDMPPKFIKQMRAGLSQIDEQVRRAVEDLF